MEELKKLKGRKESVYKIAHRNQSEMYTGAVDYEIPMFELGADLVKGGLMLL